MIEVGNHFTRSRQRGLPVVASTAYTVASSSAKNSVLTPSGVWSSVIAEWTGPSVGKAQRTQPLWRSSASRCPPLLPRKTVSPATTGCDRIVVTPGSATDHLSSSAPTLPRSIATCSAWRRLSRPRPQFSRPVTGTGVSREQALFGDPRVALRVLFGGEPLREAHALLRLQYGRLRLHLAELHRHQDPRRRQLAQRRRGRRLGLRHIVADRAGRLVESCRIVRRVRAGVGQARHRDQQATGEMERNPGRAGAA